MSASPFQLAQMVAPPAPMLVRTIERCGFHHGEGLWRVGVGGKYFFGDTERDAITEAVMTTLEDTKGPVTFTITPPLC